MESDYRGGRITSRLQLWPDEQLEGFWQVNGRDDNLAGRGEPADLTRLALVILENLGDRRELPALTADEIPDSILELTLQNEEHPGAAAHIGGLLMAVGLGMIRQAGRNAQQRGILEDGGTRFRSGLTELPFRLEIKMEPGGGGEPGHVDEPGARQPQHDRHEEPGHPDAANRQDAGGEAAGDARAP